MQMPVQEITSTCICLWVCGACNHWLQSPRVRGQQGPSIYCLLGNTEQIAENYMYNTENFGSIDSKIYLQKVQLLDLKAMYKHHDIEAAQRICTTSTTWLVDFRSHRGFQPFTISKSNASTVYFED